MAHQLACLRGNAVPAGSRPALMDSRTLGMCRDAWKNHVRHVKSSGMQLSVLQALRDAGYQCRSEHMVGRGLFCVDIGLLHSSSTRVVVEVDGPHHYSRNDVTKPLGDQLLRNRLLRALGFALVCVPGHQWLSLEDEAQRHNFLTCLVEEAVAEHRTKQISDQTVSYVESISNHS